MPPQMYNIGKIKLFNIYFPFGRDNDAKLLLAPSREGLVAPNPVGCLARTLKRTSLGPSFGRQEVPAGPVACLSPEEMWVLLGPVARGPGFAVQLVRGRTGTHREQRTLEQGAVLHCHS